MSTESDLTFPLDSSPKKVLCFPYFFDFFHFLTCCQTPFPFIPLPSVFEGLRYWHLFDFYSNPTPLLVSPTFFQNLNLFIGFFWYPLYILFVISYLCVLSKISHYHHHKCGRQYPVGGSSSVFNRKRKGEMRTFTALIPLRKSAPMKERRSESRWCEHCNIFYVVRIAVYECEWMRLTVSVQIGTVTMNDH